MTGIICLDKPSGLTSFGAVARMRRIANEKKIGHCGTLDPMATGVLPLLLGGATRFLELLPESGKAYRAKIRFGVVTDTLDITGTVLEERPSSVTEAQLNAVLEEFRGDIMQVPPMYSAVSRGGVRLYELARQGVEVEREARPVTISRLELASADEQAQEFVLDVECSKGTYIRSLTQDIGERLGCGAVLTELQRTFAAGFPLAQCVSLEQAQQLKEENRLQECLIPLDKVLEPYPMASVTQPQARRFSNGGGLALDRLSLPPKTCGYVRVYGDGLFLGLGEVNESAQELAVKRVFVREGTGCK